MDETAGKSRTSQNTQCCKGFNLKRNHPNYTTQKILAKLKKIIEISEIYQRKRLIGGNLIDQLINILTFNLHNLPLEVKLGTSVMFGSTYPDHEDAPSAKSSAKESTFAVKNVAPGTNVVRAYMICPATDNPNVSTFEEPHPATSPSCFYYKLEQGETLAIQCKERISYPEVK